MLGLESLQLDVSRIEGSFLHLRFSVTLLCMGKEKKRNSGMEECRAQYNSRTPVKNRSFEDNDQLFTQLV